MQKIQVVNAAEMDGLMIVFTELILQGFTVEDVASVMKPMNISKEEIYYGLTTCDPNWENVDYLYNTYMAWAESTREED